MRPLADRVVENTVDAERCSSNARPANAPQSHPMPCRASQECRRPCVTSRQLVATDQTASAADAMLIASDFVRMIKARGAFHETVESEYKERTFHLGRRLESHLPDVGDGPTIEHHGHPL